MSQFPMNTSTELEFYQKLLKYNSFLSSKEFVVESDLFKVYITPSGDIVSLYMRSDELVLVVPGSDSCPEWLGNFNFFPPISGFHNNYYESARSVFNELYGDLISIRKMAVLPLKIVCHSRGGFGLIIEFLLRDVGFGGITTITFGSPRVATKKGASKLGNVMCEHIRVVTKNDPVRRVPPKVTPLPIPIVWKHYESTLVELDDVRGEFDHLAYGSALKEKVRLLEAANGTQS